MTENRSGRYINATPPEWITKLVNWKNNMKTKKLEKRIDELEKDIQELISKIDRMYNVACDNHVMIEEILNKGKEKKQ